MLPAVLLISLLWQLLSTAAVLAESSWPPEQIHLSYGSTPDVMACQYATKDVDAVTKAHVYWGKDPDFLVHKAKGETTIFTDSGLQKKKQTFHVVKMTGLAPSTRYYYQVGDPEYGLSDVYSFRTPPDATTLEKHLPLRFAVYGDMGLDVDGSTILQNLNKHLDMNPDYFDTVLHVGDMAYDMFERNGAQGDDFMNMIQPVAARTSYLVDMGNHEEMYRFSHYTERFRNMPISDPQPIWTFHGPAPNNWWYSLNIGPMHLVTISTEIYDYVPWLVQRQYEWLERDLIEANRNRSQAPWLIVNGHKPIYCGSPSSVLCDDWYVHQREGLYEHKYGLEALFYKYGVDLYVCGHQHNYERMYDIAPNSLSTQSTVNPPATTYIVTGAGGNREDNTPFEEAPDPRVAFRAPEWGYSVMEIHNNTHLHWEQRACDNHQDGGKRDDEDKLIDAFWLIQEDHGPFTERRLRGGKSW